jgi:hypothetical protein
LSWGRLKFKDGCQGHAILPIAGGTFQEDGRLHQVIRLHVAAPPKPAEHQPCNGCGVCCASAPCPLGVLASGRLHGPCAALTWVDEDRLYRCGLILRPQDHLPGLLRRAAPLLAALARRCTAAGVGCDCNLAVHDGGS